MEVSKLELKEKRIKSNLKVKGICERLGVSRGTYYRMEIGTRKVNATEREKLDKILNTKEID